MEENVIGTLVINYEKLSKLETEGKKISKYKEEYEYQLEKNIIASLHNVTDEYSSNINDAETYIKNKIAALNEDSEQMMDFLKQVNELLELADAMDREVAALYQDNMERFQGISSKVGGYDGFWSIFRSIGDGIRALAYSSLELLGLEDIYTDFKTKVRYWYECEGGRELFKTIGQGVLFGLEVAGLIGAVLAIGTVGPIIGACAIAVGVIGVANSAIGVSNSFKAYGYAKGENPAMARVIGDRTTVADELKAHNFGSVLLNDVSNIAASGLVATELVLSVVCFSADAKLLKKGKEAVSSFKSFAKNTKSNIVDTLKKVPQKGGDLKNAVKAGYNNGKKFAKELGGEVVTKGKQAVKHMGDALVGKKVSSASKNTDTIVDLKKMDVRDSLGSVGEGSLKSTLYDELYEIKTPEARYEYLLDKARTMDVSTDKNSAIFYAGRVETASGTKTARQIAENYADELFKNKGVVKLTLERTPGGKWMDDLKLYDTLLEGTYKYESLGLSKQQVNSLWDVLSSRYADGASGAVTAFSKNVPDFIKPKTVFWSTELPKLRNNPNVTHINIR